MTEARQSIAGAYQKIEGHERECAIRYAGIIEALADVKSDLRWIIRGGAVVVLSVLAWGGAQLWSTVQPKAEAHALPVEARR
jgi:hypothetical protein